LSSHHQKTALIHEKLEQRILHGLLCEWETAQWVLSSTHSKRMQKPLFSLSDMPSKLGHWSGQKCEICLDRQFVLNHSWDSVREVLLHEMAHQFADQVLGADNEPPHGPSFRKACRLLRANPKASGSYRPLWEQVRQDAPAREDKILLRIKKLMALAESHNQYEAEAAMTKAYELIGKYNIDLFAGNEKRDFLSIFIGKPALRHPRENYHIARLLLDFYFVNGIWIPAYVLEKGKMGRVLEITGTRQNIKIASYTYDFVRRFINSQWQVYTQDKTLHRHRKTDFAVGIIEGFRSKLESRDFVAKTIKNRSALVEVEDPLLNKYMDYKYPHTKSFTRTASSQDDAILEDGMKVGRKMVISKGITAKKKSIRLLPLMDGN
jgi:hypothetical protein